MPPERLIQLALRMAKTIGDEGQFCATNIEVETVKKWFSGDRNLYAKQLIQLYRDDEGNWFAYVKTEDLGIGCFYLEVTATIPDAHAPQGAKIDIQRYQFDEHILP